MPANLNPQVLELLSWHGHAAGGVHVPFQERQSPLGQVVETSLLRRLRTLATQIAANPASRPRWVFLVGGPGNGKSETVQDFLVQLDGALGMGGALRAGTPRALLAAGSPQASRDPPGGPRKWRRGFRGKRRSPRRCSRRDRNRERDGQRGQGTGG